MTESESEGSEVCLFLPTPLLLQSRPFLLPSRRFTLDQNAFPISNSDSDSDYASDASVASVDWPL